MVDFAYSLAVPKKSLCGFRVRRQNVEAKTLEIVRYSGIVWAEFVSALIHLFIAKEFNEQVEVKLWSKLV
jgi:hypothetical protein